MEKNYFLKDNTNQFRKPVFKSEKRGTLTVFALTSMLMFFSALTMNAQISQTVPNITASSGFTGVYASSARTYQLIIDDSQLTPLTGQYLTSIAFRLPSNATSSWPATDATYSNFQIFLSNGVDPANRQLDFAANVVGTQTQVKTGSLVVPAGALTFGSDPNAFSHILTFDTPYLYNGTNLVIEIRHTGNDVGSRSTNSTGTSTAGYGSLYTACWQGTSGVMQGNFSFVQINSVSSLGVKSVEIDEGLSVYPNPVKDLLYVKSSGEISEFHVFNFVGQKIHSQKNTSKTPQLNVTNFPSGNYMLQLIYKNGNSSSVRFIKE
ncbi:MAG: T9SS type A sorting domain-containing protein [Kaistella sp.]|nr:T9SS type A sorting domain-containing protein [Kaistella sp.]